MRTEMNTLFKITEIKQMFKNTKRKETKYKFIRKNEKLEYIKLDNDFLYLRNEIGLNLRIKTENMEDILEINEKISVVTLKKTVQIKFGEIKDNENIDYYNFLSVIDILSVVLKIKEKEIERILKKYKKECFILCSKNDNSKVVFKNILTLVYLNLKK